MELALILVGHDFMLCAEPMERGRTIELSSSLGQRFQEGIEATEVDWSLGAGEDMEVREDLECC